MGALGRRSIALRLTGVLAIVSLTLGTAASAAAVTEPLITMTLTATPHVDTASITYTGTLTPYSGTPHNLRVQMEPLTGNFAGGGERGCEPAANCTIDFIPRWDFPVLTGKQVITFTAGAQTGFGVRLDIVSEGTGCVGTCPAVVTTPQVTHTSTLSYTTSGQVVTGATLHITARVSTDLWWTVGGAMMVVELPSGIAAPTNLPVDATYNGPPRNDIERLGNATPSDEFSFDVVVTAATGSTLHFTSSYSYGGALTKNGSLTIKVGPDHAAPVTTAPTRTFVTGAALTSSAVPVRIGWTGSDSQTGVASYDLAQSTDGGVWSTVATGLTSTTSTRSLIPGHSYRFRVRGTDHVGNTGAWTYGTTFKLSSTSETSSSIHYGGTWAYRTSALYRGGHEKAASIAGRTATWSFTGTSVAWVATKGPSQGRANVYVNGTLLTSVDLWAPANQWQRLVWTKTWSTSATRTITVKVLGTIGHPTVDLDGLIFIR
jgi:hypothetical protein